MTRRTTFTAICPLRRAITPFCVLICLQFFIFSSRHEGFPLTQGRNKTISRGKKETGKADKMTGHISAKKIDSGFAWQHEHENNRLFAQWENINFAELYRSENKCCFSPNIQFIFNKMRKIDNSKFSWGCHKFKNTQEVRLRLIRFAVVSQKSCLVFKCLSKGPHRSNDSTHRNTYILTLAAQYPRRTKPRIGSQGLALSFYYCRILEVSDSSKQGQTPAGAGLNVVWASKHAQANLMR